MRYLNFPSQQTLFPVNAPPVLGARSLRSDSKLRWAGL
jgi:hypothetical protein